MNEERTILHVDLNNFYASVECLYDTTLSEKPMAVGGNEKARHGIILAKNDIAKAFGVKTGEPLWQARKKCPELIFVKPHHDRYLNYSRMARSIYEEYTAQVESFGLDECWLDVTHSKALHGNGKQIADEIRRRIKEELGLTVSVGVSFNKVFAKLGSDLKKPDATTVIAKDSFKRIVWPLPVGALLFVGRATQKSLREIGITTIGDLAQANPTMLSHKFGKNGRMLYNYANGFEDAPVSETTSQREIKSIGNSFTFPRDLITDDDVKIPLYVLCESVAERLREHGFKCQTAQLSIKDNTLFQYERQIPLDIPTNSAKELFEKTFSLFKSHHLSKTPIRSMGVRALKLEPFSCTQLAFLPEIQKVQNEEAREQVIDAIRHKYGHFSVQRGIMLLDTNLSGFHPKEKNVIHPEVFVR